MTERSLFSLDANNFDNRETPDLFADLDEGFFDDEPSDEVPQTALEALASIEPGPSLSLLARAKALDIIMKQFNQENKALGAQASRGYNGMQGRYGADTGRVMDRMSASASRMGVAARGAVDTLTDGDIGVPTQRGIDYSGQIESSLRRGYGPGRADAGKRSKLITTVFRTAGTTKSKHQ